MKLRSAARVVGAALMLLSAWASHANGCLKHPIMPAPPAVSFGVVRVSSATAVGAVLAERSTTGSTGEFACHNPTRTSSLNLFQTPSALGDHVYETNVPGVGVRILFRYKPGDVAAPDNSYLPGVFKGGLHGATVQLIKTGPIGEDGALRTGRLAHAGYDRKVQAWVDLADARIERERPTCLFQSRRVVFDLGKVDSGELAAHGHTAWVTAPLVVTECRHATKLQLTFNGEADLTRASLFRLNGLNAARGVAVELRSVYLDGQIVPNDPLPLELTVVPGAHQHEFRARYKRNDESLTPGPANARITVKVDYR